MRRTLRYHRLMWTKHDLSAGLSVFFVALPLCLGIALASGAPIYSGLLSGIIGGVVVSWISGSTLSVSGPAAGLSTLVLGSIALLGDFKLFLLAVIIAGIFQIILGVAKLGVISNYFPSSVIKGMLAAIGIILISKQIPIAIGYDQPDFWESGFSNLFTSKNILGNLKLFLLHFTRGTVIITLLSLGLLLLLKRPFARRLSFLPAPLVVVIFGILAGYVSQELVDDFSLKQTQLVSIPNNVFAEIKFPDLSNIFSNKEIWYAGLKIGLLASLETLLCIEAIDKLDRHNRITPVNRELIAQGVGNMLCGLLGAIPMTAVVVRGAANVQAGAKTKLSSVTHGVFILLAVLLIPFVLNRIPLASLAAILLITGYNLTKPELYVTMWKLGWKQFLPFIITIIIILTTDLLIGVSIGLLLSIYFIIQNNFRSEFNIQKETHKGIEEYYIKLYSNVTFLNKVNLKKALDKIPEYSILTIDGGESQFIDFDILEIISEYENKAHDRHIELHLKNITRVKLASAGH